MVGPFGLLACFLAFFFSGFGVAVGVASPGEAATSSLLSGRIIIAIATPAPRNAAVAIRPVMRRAQRDALRLAGN